MTVKDRYNGLQDTLIACGESGCHFLALCSIAEEYNKKPLDLIWAIRTLQSKGLLRSDFYVKDDGCQVLSILTNGKKWTRKDVVSLPVIQDNEYTEAVYFNPRTQFTHFRRRYVDTKVNSVTVAEGHLKEYRIYTVQV